MDTFFAVLSFPFWFAGFVFVVAGLFGTVKVGGNTYRGEHLFAIKAGVTAVGIVFLAVATGLVMV